MIFRRTENFQQRFVHGFLQFTQRQNRLVAQSARGDGQNAQQALVIAVIDEQFQVRGGVLDFLALEEGLSADDFRGNAAGTQFLFKGARQMVGTEQHRKIRPAAVGFTVQNLLHHVRDKPGFRFPVAQTEYPNRISFAFCGPEIFIVTG